MITNEKYKSDMNRLLDIIVGLYMTAPTYIIEELRMETNMLRQSINNISNTEDALDIYEREQKNKEEFVNKLKKRWKWACVNKDSDNLTFDQWLQVNNIPL